MQTKGVGQKDLGAKQSDRMPKDCRMVFGGCQVERVIDWRAMEVKEPLTRERKVEKMGKVGNKCRSE